MTNNYSEELIKQAKQASNNAYAPYSSFKVGAALLAANGKVYVGCNVENATYGATICAERAAVAMAIADGQREFTALALYTKTPKPLTPCGICRQVLCEFSPQMKIIAACENNQIQISTLQDLLPDAFTLNK